MITSNGPCSAAKACNAAGPFGPPETFGSDHAEMPKNHGYLVHRFQHPAANPTTLPSWGSRPRRAQSRARSPIASAACHDSPQALKHRPAYSHGAAQRQSPCRTRAYPRVTKDWPQYPLRYQRRKPPRSIRLRLQKNGPWHESSPARGVARQDH